MDSREKYYTARGLTVEVPTLVRVTAIMLRGDILVEKWDRELGPLEWIVYRKAQPRIYFTRTGRRKKC